MVNLDKIVQALSAGLRPRNQQQGFDQQFAHQRFLTSLNQYDQQQIDDVLADVISGKTTHSGFTFLSRITGNVGGKEFYQTLNWQAFMALIKKASPEAARAALLKPHTSAPQYSYYTILHTISSVLEAIVYYRPYENLKELLELDTIKNMIDVSHLPLFAHIDYDTSDGAQKWIALLNNATEQNCEALLKPFKEDGVTSYILLRFAARFPEGQTLFVNIMDKAHLSIVFKYSCITWDADKSATFTFSALRYDIVKYMRSLESCSTQFKGPTLFSLYTEKTTEEELKNIVKWVTEDTINAINEIDPLQTAHTEPFQYIPACTPLKFAAEKRGPAHLRILLEKKSSEEKLRLLMTTPHSAVQRREESPLQLAMQNYSSLQMKQLLSDFPELEKTDTIRKFQWSPGFFLELPKQEASSLIALRILGHAIIQAYPSDHCLNTLKYKLNQPTPMPILEEAFKRLLAEEIIDKINMYTHNGLLYGWKNISKSLEDIYGLNNQMNKSQELKDMKDMQEANKTDTKVPQQFSTSTPSVHFNGNPFDLLNYMM